MNNKGHIKIRRGINEHIEKGYINAIELGVYLYLHLNADYIIGSIRSFSAKSVAENLRTSYNLITKALRNLEKNGYIRRFLRKGQRTYYPLVLNKFELPNGAVLRADKYNSFQDLLEDVKPKVNRSETESKPKVKEKNRREELKKLRREERINIQSTKGVEDSNSNSNFETENFKNLIGNRLQRKVKTYGIEILDYYHKFFIENFNREPVISANQIFRIKDLFDANVSLENFKKVLQIALTNNFYKNKISLDTIINNFDKLINSEFENETSCSHLTTRQKNAEAMKEHYAELKLKKKLANKKKRRKPK